MDLRSPIQRKLDDLVGPPLYYSSRCKLPVKVATEENEVKIARPCGECACEVIAPRKAIAVGEGGVNLATKVKTTISQIAAAATGRCV